MLGWTNYRSDQFMLIALALTDLPNTRQALERGELEFSEVRTIVDRLTLLPPADRAAVDEAIFPEVLKLWGGLLRLYVEAEIIKINPEATKERHKKAREDRGVAVYPDVDNVSTLRLHGIPHDQAAQAWAYLDAIARTMKSGGDERTLPQLRADIAVSLLSGEGDVIICDSAPECGEEEACSGDSCQDDVDAAAADEGEANASAEDDDEACGYSAAESDGCRHIGCDHDHHLAGCPCEDCKPATYTHPLDRPGHQPRSSGAREEIPSDDDLAEQEIPVAFRSWKAAVKAKLQLNVPITTLFELAERP
ncbi:DUF222 domain-containing protein, partial [Actinopolymorpha alba]|uniref:DUF222 domain-containing protein n=1 Tax=Actinopolymorpha alba TaxID=533267 RepID=UPI00058C3FF3